MTLKADYSLSVEETFTESSRAIIIGNGSLDIFNALRVSGSRKYELPSWVPDWSSAGLTTMNDAVWDHRKYNPFAASAGRPYRPLSNQEHFLALSVRGRSVARVSYLARKPVGAISPVKRIIQCIPLDTYVEQVQRNCPLLENVSRERLLRVVLTDCITHTGKVLPDMSDVLHHYDVLCSEKERAIFQNLPWMAMSMICMTSHLRYFREGSSAPLMEN